MNRWDTIRNLCVMDFGPRKSFTARLTITVKKATCSSHRGIVTEQKWQIGISHPNTDSKEHIYIQSYLFNSTCKKKQPIFPLSKLLLLIHHLRRPRSRSTLVISMNKIRPYTIMILSSSSSTTSCNTFIPAPCLGSQILSLIFLPFAAHFFDFLLVVQISVVVFADTAETLVEG